MGKIFFLRPKDGIIGRIPSRPCFTNQEYILFRDIRTLVNNIYDFYKPKGYHHEKNNTYFCFPVLPYGGTE